MKKLLITGIAGCCLAFGVSSCTKQEPVNTNTSISAHTDQSREQTFSDWYAQNRDRLDEVTRSEIITFDNIETQKSIFNVLPAARKAYVWKEKYNALLAAPGYTQAQKDFFNTCVSYLSEELYSSESYHDSKHNSIQDLRTSGESLFTREQLIIIMATLGDAAKPWSGGNVDACECSVKSDWCDFPVDVGGHCDSNACNQQSNSGCGTWWSYSCSGDCII